MSNPKNPMKPKIELFGFVELLGFCGFL